MSNPSVPGTQPANPDPESPLDPSEEPMDASIPRGRPDAPEQYPDDKDMPLPND